MLLSLPDTGSGWPLPPASGLDERRPGVVKLEHHKEEAEGRNETNTRGDNPNSLAV